MAEKKLKIKTGDIEVLSEISQDGGDLRVVSIAEGEARSAPFAIGQPEKRGACPMCGADAMVPAGYSDEQFEYDLEVFRHAQAEMVAALVERRQQASRLVIEIDPEAIPTATAPRFLRPTKAAVAEPVPDTIV